MPTKINSANVHTSENGEHYTYGTVIGSPAMIQLEDGQWIPSEKVPTSRRGEVKIKLEGHYSNNDVEDNYDVCPEYYQLIEPLQIVEEEKADKESVEDAARAYATKYKLSHHNNTHFGAEMLTFIAGAKWQSSQEQPKQSWDEVNEAIWKLCGAKFLQQDLKKIKEKFNPPTAIKQ